LALIRGDRKNPSLHGPTLDNYRELYRYVQSVWAPREERRFGSIVEPMLQWAKTKTAIEQRQVVPCRAGRLSAVIYANGDVSFCETHAPLGNLRDKTFTDMWKSAAADTLRASIDAKACWCTNEVFLWPSIVFQPAQLARAMAHANPWKKPESGVAPPESRPANDLINIG
jgi:MoaA/NifB/PqqE/SkfB family radical SAM enzyme